MEDGYLSTGQAARLLGVSAKTITRWADVGAVPYDITPGGHRRMRRVDVERLAVRRGDGSNRAAGSPGE